MSCTHFRFTFVTFGNQVSTVALLDPGTGDFLVIRRGKGMWRRWGSMQLEGGQVGLNAVGSCGVPEW